MRTFKARDIEILGFDSQFASRYIWPDFPERLTSPYVIYGLSRHAIEPAR